MCSCAQTTRKMATLTGSGSLCTKVRQCGSSASGLHCIARGALSHPMHHFSTASARHS